MDRTVEWEAETTQDEENELIAWHSLPGSEIVNQGTVHFEDVPGNRGTEVHINLIYHPPAGSASAMIARLFGEEPAQQVYDDLHRFKQILEAGEIATTFGQTSARIYEVEKERQELGSVKYLDVVQKASEASFPASLNPHDAIIKVTSTAICGSDLHLYDGFIPSLMKDDILGHWNTSRKAGLIRHLSSPIILSWTRLRKPIKCSRSTRTAVSRLSSILN